MPQITADTAQHMLDTMARMQAEHNAKVHPEWATQGYEYYRAIWVECAELLDHFGWKWWKHQAPDLEQARLELVDIWHFGLSELIRDDSMDAGTLASLLTLPSGDQADPGTDPAGFRAAVEALAGATLTSRSFPMAQFVAALAALPMSYAELFELYIGKNVLNRFRQDHGYKEGTYRKLWDGREDNEHLMEVVAALDAVDPDYVDRLYGALADRYGANAE